MPLYVHTCTHGTITVVSGYPSGTKRHILKIMPAFVYDTSFNFSK